MLGELYTKTQELSAWLKKLDKQVETQLKNNVPVKGWKLVAGRSNRVFTDVDKAYEVLSEAAKLDKEMFYSRVPLGITEASKLVGKKLFDATCEPYMTKSQGKPAVVPESDPRKAIDTSAASDFADMAAPQDKPSDSPNENPQTNTKNQGGN